jgi:hypothetical protein
LDRISVSPGNGKMGTIPSISFPPLLTCRKDPPCKDVCYARKPYLTNRSVQRAWQRNLSLYRANPSSFFQQLYAYIIWHCVERFRWFVAGDIPDIAFFSSAKALCRATPKTAHLMFTKRYDLNLDLSDCSDNLNLMISTYPGLEIPQWAMGQRKAFYQDGSETRMNGTEHICSGHCEDCLHCWNKTGDVVFIKH